MLTEAFSAWHGAVRTALLAASVAAGMVFGTDDAVAAAGRCAPAGTPVEHRTLITQGPVVFDTSRDKVQLTALFQGEQARMTSRSWTTVGLTESSLEIRTSTRTLATPAPGGGWCAEVQDVRVEIGYPQLTVYIPREYRAGTCAHDVVHSHELEHVAITRDVLDRHAPALSAAVGVAVADINPMWAPTKAQARRLAAEVVQAHLEAPVERLKQEHRSRNAAIDSQENYHHLQSLCPEW